ncbi:MAG: DNA cytosine methyltransferase [Victivallaceae bacterium]|nr:DNA cytosine methyltransferase [Victivallaceae bacterium]
MYELELFAGAGGGILGKNLLGLTTIGAVEIEPFGRKVLLDRQRDLCLPCFPIWDDVRSFRIDNPDCRAYIEWLRSIAGKLCVSGGFPCQNISSGGKGEGIRGKRSGLWFEMARIIGEIRPALAFVENSPLLCTRGLEQVLASLAEMGYNAKWCVLGAGHLNYPIKRDRIWILGKYNQDNGPKAPIAESVAFEKYVRSIDPIGTMSDVAPAWLMANGYAVRKPDGMAGGVDGAKAAGNGQVPAVAALAWQVLTGGKYND